MLYLENTLGNSSIAEVVPLLFEKCHDADRNGIAATGFSIHGDMGISPKFIKQPAELGASLKAERKTARGPAPWRVLGPVPAPSHMAEAVLLLLRCSVSVCGWWPCLHAVC